MIKKGEQEDIMNNNIEQKAREILKGMTLNDKIGQVTQIPLVVSKIEDAFKAIRKYRPGSIILAGSAFAGNEKQQALYVEKLNAIQKVAVEELPAGIPLLFGRDIIHGHRVVFPNPLTLTASFDFDLIEQCYQMIREEAYHDGVTWTFSPMIDYCHEPRWGRMVEGPGEDPYLGGLYARAAVRGFQSDNLSEQGAIAACAKHYIGYGASEGGRDYTHTEISDYQLQNNFLAAFREAVKSGVATVMASFNDVNGIPVSGNKPLLTDILRDQLSFDGFVVSDWDGIMQMAKFQGFCADKREAAQKALEAGIDMDMACMSYYDHIHDLIQSGNLDISVLDTAVLRILSVKLRMGLWEHPYVLQKDYDLDSHLKYAEKAAAESIVLLKNNNQILPLKKNSVLYLCGPYADCSEELVGSWSLDCDYSLVHTVSDVMKSKIRSLTVMPLKDSRTTLRNRKSGAEVAVVILGENRAVTGEANSLADISIPPEQLCLLRELKKSGIPIIGVMCFARPIAFGEYDYLFDAILYAGHGGSRAAEAIVSVLFGYSEPGGRLPFTLPYSGNQIPIYYNCLPGSRPVNGYYGEIDPWFCNYADCPDGPNYPFGYGLSYTSFSLSEITCETVNKSMANLSEEDNYMFEIIVKNTGTSAGTAVLQLYVHDLAASRIRPMRSLRSIRRVFLSAGDSCTVTFSVGKEDLGFYLENGTFTLEPGEFDVYIGENCLTDNKIRITLQKE